MAHGARLDDHDGSGFVAAAFDADAGQEDNGPSIPAQLQRIHEAGLKPIWAGFLVPAIATLKTRLAQLGV